MSLTIRRLPEQLQELSRNINDVSITNGISKLLVEANSVTNCVNKAFAVTGCDVLQQKQELARVSCPKRVQIEKLSNTLSVFNGDLRACTNGTIALKTSINDFIGISRFNMKMKETEINAAKTVVEGLDKQIRQTEEDIRKKEEEADNEERGSVDLDNRASDLRRQSQEHKDKGLLWGIGSVLVGIVFAPFTMGASLAPALISAGVGIGVNFDNANDCERTAARLRASAEDKRDNARRKRQLKNELESKRSTKSTLLRNYHMEIENLSKTCDGLVRLEMLLSTSLSGFEHAIYIAQELQNSVHKTLLAGDSFQLIREVFLEYPEEFHDEAHEEMHKLKLKWIELEAMFISNSDHHGITYY